MLKGLFIFRRDLRADDNIALQQACNECDIVYCVFIFDDRQIKPSRNIYFGYNSFWFMLNSLVELKNDIPLGLLYAKDAPHKMIANLVKELQINKIYVNADYTPFAIKRDKEITNEIKIPYEIIHGDLCLSTPLDIKPYAKFTPYYNASKIRVKSIVSHGKLKHIDKIKPIKHFKQVNIGSMIQQIKNKVTSQQTPGRKAGLQILKTLQLKQKNYGKNRDDLIYETSHLSPHLRFGTVSVREAYQACNNGVFRKQLYWRDFYIQMGYHHPNTLIDKEMPKFKEARYNIEKNFRPMKIHWINDKHLFNLWCKGKTGVPIVDACMTELNKSGFMHNRGRLIVSSFLIKILHIDWRFGEQYFAQKLVDYDPYNNGGNWQWSAGTGADAQPYFRIFNPYTQGLVHDTDASYIKKWLNEFRDQDSKQIHKIRSGLIDYEKERELCIKYYR